MNALVQVAPERVIAEGFDSTTPVCLSHLGDSGYNIYLEILGGGYGAGSANDGCDAVDCPLSNCANIPIESVEMDYDFMRIENYALVADSGGLGRQRGGLGFERAYRILKDNVQFATYSDRFEAPPRGLLGGGDGAVASMTVVRTGGGGGYGPPEERVEALRQSDQILGLVSR